MTRICKYFDGRFQSENVVVLGSFSLISCQFLTLFEYQSLLLFIYIIIIVIVIIIINIIIIIIFIVIIIIITIYYCCCYFSQLL